MSSKTMWYVVTGGPSSGKTTTVEILKKRGYRITIEHARHYIDTQLVTGKTVEEVRRNQIEFQHRILHMQIAEENNLPKDELVFLDRAIPDALAYYRFLGLPMDEVITSALKQAQYKKIFILDPLPLVSDYARTEDQAAQLKIHELLTDVYASLGFPIAHIPVLPPEERVDFILENL